MKRSLLLFSFLVAAAPAWAEPTPLSITVDHGVPLTLKGSAASVFIANPDIADVQVMSPSQIMVFGKRTGETTFMATDGAGKTLAERTVIVSQDISKLREQLDAAIPGHNIKVKSVPGGLVLTGEVKDATSVADAYKIAMRYLPAGGDIINRVQVSGSNQVQIRVRFAEVQRKVDNSLGFNWQNVFSGGSNLTVGLATGNGVNMTGSGIFNSGSANTSGLFPRPSNTALSTSNGVLGAALKTGNFTIDGMIDALAQEGFLTILAEPNLTAMSGETASFLAGGEFPIPIPQGNNMLSITFKNYGISLSFTPTLLSGNRISLHVRPEVSELTTSGAIIMSNITVPALSTRKAETTVEVASGESFAIAGLMDNNQANTVNKFPMLGDLPVLGALFRSNHFQNNQSELVVIITPYIVKPSEQRLAAPTDGFAPPSDSDRLVELRNANSDPNARPISGEPVGVMAAPAAAPVAPVTPALQPDPAKKADQAASKPAPVAALPVPSATPAAPAPLPTAALPDTAAVVSAAAPTVATNAPLVLHPSHDGDKRGGGLLVE